jgi:hypothetical protein
MTRIVDTTTWAVDGEFREADPSFRRSSARAPLVVMLCASAILVTGLNLVAAVHLYSAGAEIKAVEAKLDRLTAFEKRLMNQLDLVNTGLQSQFDQIDRDLQGSFGEIDRQLARLGLDMTASVVDPTSSAIALSDAAQPAPEPEPKVVSAPPASAAVEPIRRAAGTPRMASPSYERIELPDGKVHYRKVR